MYVVGQAKLDRQWESHAPRALDISSFAKEVKINWLLKRSNIMLKYKE